MRHIINFAKVGGVGMVGVVLAVALAVPAFGGAHTVRAMGTLATAKKALHTAISAKKLARQALTAAGGRSQPGSTGKDGDRGIAGSQGRRGRPVPRASREPRGRRDPQGRRLPRARASLPRAQHRPSRPAKTRG